MADIEVLKDKLKNDFNAYIKGYIERLGTISGSEFTIDDADAKARYRQSFIIPKINESDTSPGTGASSPVLTALFPKPSTYDAASYDKGIKQMRDGVTKAGSWIKDVPGWSQYFDALSSVRNVGYTVIFHSQGLSQYAKTQPEYAKYVEDLRSNPNFGNEIVDELIKYGWLTNPATYSPGIEWNNSNPGPEFTRDEQEKRIALMLWHWKNSKDIFAFIENYRWFPSKAPADQKKADADNIKAWKDRYKLFSNETIDAYGAIDPNGNLTAVSSKFKSRYDERIFYIAVDILYAVEVELQKNNPNYSGDLFKDLVNADQTMRRRRALGKLVDKNGKLNENLWNDFWSIVIENYDKFIAESQKGPKKGYMRDPKTGDYKRDQSGEKIIQEISADMWVEQILSGTPEAFIKALSVGKMNPKYRAWRTDPGGNPAVQFEWSPDSETLREIYILMAFKEDPDRLNRILYPSTPVKKGSDDGEDKKGIFKKIFGESVGFKSSESPTSTRGKEKSEARVETSINNPSLNEEARLSEQNKDFSEGGKEEKKSQGEASSAIGATPQSSVSESNSSNESGTELGSATSNTNITNTTVNQAINTAGSNTTINKESSALNTQENKNISVKNESTALAGGESGTVNVNNENVENKNVANINNLSQTGGSTKSEDLTQVNQSGTTINDASSRSINNSASNTESLTGGNQSSSTSVTNLNPLVSNSSISSNKNETNEGSANSVTNMNTESRASEINIDRKQVSVSNVQSNNVKSESLTAQTQNTPIFSEEQSNSSTVNNVTNQNEGNQTAGNVTNNTDNSMSKTPIIQNNIDMSEMISRLKRIEEALLSPLEVKILDA